MATSSRAAELEKDRRDAEADFRREGLTARALSDAVAMASRNVLRERIDRLLLIQKGKELDLKVDGEVAKQIADIQRRSAIADPEKFQQYVHEQSGMPYEDYRNEIKNKALMDHVIRQEVSSTIKIKREDMQKYYDEHKRRVPASGADFPPGDLYFDRRQGRRRRSGGRAESQGPGGARAQIAKNSRIWRQPIPTTPTPLAAARCPSCRRASCSKPIEDAVWNQPRGYVTDPIKVVTGFYIYKVVEHQQAGLADFEQVQNEVEDRLFRPKMDPALREYLTKLRAEAFLEIKPGYEDSGAAPGKNTAWVDPAQLKPETVTKEEVAARTRKRKLLWVVPIPGTSTKSTGTSSSH